MASTINDLPEEILWMIFKFLPKASIKVPLKSFRLTGEYSCELTDKITTYNDIMVCKRWKQIVENNAKFSCTFFESSHEGIDYEKILRSEKCFQKFSFLSSTEHPILHLVYFQKMLSLHQSTVKETVFHMYSADDQGLPDLRHSHVNQKHFHSMIESLKFMVKIKFIFYHNVINSQPSNPWIPTLWELRHLTHLEIYTCFSDDRNLAEIFLENVTTENLESLQIQTVEGSIIPSCNYVFKFVNESNLEKLRLFNIKTASEKLHWTPQRLEINCRQGNHDENVHLERFLQNHSRNLKTIAVEGSGTEWYRVLFEDGDVVTSPSNSKS